jgi:hypothetical protein
MKLFADIGNYSAITALEGDTPLLMRSVQADITASSVMAPNNQQSPTVLCDGKKYILGEYATKQKNCQSLVAKGKDKAEAVKPYLFAGLRENFNGELHYLLPKRDRRIEDGHRSKFIDTHEITVNGKFYKHTVTDIKFYLESDVATENAFLSGVIPDDGDCLAIDIGGGTTNYLIMTPDSNVLRRNSLQDVGGVSLANDIINSDWMKSRNYPFKPEKVMDAIADGSLIYGRNHDFSSVFKPLFENWFNGLVDHIMLDCRDYLADVGTVMFLGGNANLIRERVANQPGYYIPENPQLANIHALLNIQ